MTSRIPRVLTMFILRQTAVQVARMAASPGMTRPSAARRNPRCLITYAIFRTFEEEQVWLVKQRV